MAVSRTAQYVALYRALETHEHRRAPLFRDPFAEGFLTRGMALAVTASRAPLVRGLLERYADRRAPGSRTSAIARTAYIDDAVRGALNDGVEQVVILGAGYDCRAHRMPELAGVAVFEVDQPDTQAAKRARLPAVGAAGVHYVAVNFLKDDVAAKLAEAGWDRARRSLFIWEGVTGYLTEPAVIGVLRWIATAAPGSRVVFTYLHGGLLDGTTQFEGGTAQMARVERLGEPWTFGLHPDAVGGFVARCGLHLREDLGADEYRRRYLGDRASAGYRFYRIAIADVGLQ